MTRTTVVSLLVATAAYLANVGAQDGNDCSCTVVLEQQEADPQELYKESTSILGSLCTDADFEFCSGFCKQEMSAFAGPFKQNYAATNKSVGQSLCDVAKKPVKEGLIKMAATVCEQDAREIGLKQEEKLCCDKNATWVVPCH